MQQNTTDIYRDHIIQAQDCIGIFVREFAPNAVGTPIVCLPGLTRNHRDFTQLAEILAQGPSQRRVICIDFRGRGGSDRDPDPSHYNLLTEMTDVVAVLDALHIKTADFIGTSRGGMVTHVLAAMHPQRINKVVLNDIGPVIEKQGLIRIKDYVNRADAPKSWDECASYLQAVHGDSFPTLPASEWEAMAKALYRDENGRPVADYDKAIAAPIASMNFDQPIPDLWAQYEALSQFPLLIIRGELSELLSQQCCDKMLTLNLRATQITAPQQGHAPLLHLAPVAQAIVEFLKPA
jgi:pimeloyl-ACP methyl ester carboxylesterase